MSQFLDPQVPIVVRLLQGVGCKTAHVRLPTFVNVGHEAVRTAGVRNRDPVV